MLKIPLNVYPYFLQYTWIFSILFCYFGGGPRSLRDPSSPNTNPNQAPRQWKRRVPTTRPPEFPCFIFLNADDRPLIWLHSPLMVGIFKSPAHLGKQNDVSFPCHVSWNTAMKERVPEQVLTPSGSSTKLSGIGICFPKAYHSEKHPETHVTYRSSKERRQRWIWNLKECNNCRMYTVKDEQLVHSLKSIAETVASRKQSQPWDLTWILILACHFIRSVLSRSQRLFSHT